MGDLVIQDGQ